MPPRAVVGHRGHRRSIDDDHQIGTERPARKRQPGGSRWSRRRAGPGAGDGSRPAWPWRPWATPGGVFVRLPPVGPGC